MAEAGHPSVGGWRTVTGRHRGRVHALGPAARLRGQRTVCSAHARRFGASREVVTLSEAQDRTLFNGRCIAPQERVRCSFGTPAHAPSALRLRNPRRPARTVVPACSASARCPPVLRTGSNSNAHAGYGIGLCTLQGCHVTESCLTWRSTDIQRRATMARFVKAVPPLAAGYLYVRRRNSTQTRSSVHCGSWPKQRSASSAI